MLYTILAIGTNAAPNTSRRIIADGFQEGNSETWQFTTTTTHTHTHTCTHVYIYVYIYIYKNYVPKTGYMNTPNESLSVINNPYESLSVI